MSTIIKDLGAVTAYAYAVEHGYEGTEEEFAELMASYAEVAIEAEASAQSAALSAETATAQAQSASDSADEASASATTASTKADEASQSASLASSKASDASTYANTATTKAGEASASATSASQSASSAASDAAAIMALVSTAEGYAERAEAAVTASEGFAGDASDSATSAESSATSASRSATTATQKAAAASGSASTAMDSALKSEGYAVGKQNGTDVGSDSPYYHNNAKYYAEGASDSATSASGSATTASTKASEASTSATNASASATSASESATEASGYATSAQESAESAEASAQTVSEAVERLEEIDHKAPVIVNTASGSIASFSDGADDMPCKSVVCQIDAVQDLHGQDAPYPAGGGKNLFNPDNVLGCYIEYASPNKLRQDSNYKTIYAPVIAGQTYTISKASGTRLRIGFTSELPVVNMETTNFSAPDTLTATVTAPSGANYICVFCVASGETASAILDTVQIEKGSTATSYAPYSNICPITGWDGVTVVRSGINLCDPSTISSGYYGDGGVFNNNSDYKTSALIPVKANTTYIASLFDGTKTRVNRLAYTEWDKNGGFVKSTTNSNAVTTTPTTAFIRIRNLQSNIEAVAGTFYYQLELGSTASSYIPFVANDVYSLTFPSTVYGGWVDVVKGELHITHGYVDLGTLNWSYNTTYSRFLSQTTDIPNIKKPANNDTKANILCDRYLTATSNDTASATNNNLIACGASGSIVIRDTAYTDAATFKTALSGAQLVYELATEQVIPIDPVTIKTLLGNNNVYCNTGDSSVEYPADTRLYIEHLTAPDHDMIADSNISSGKFFMVGNSLYISTSAIASGETIVPGTNCNQINLATALNNIAEA